MDVRVRLFAILAELAGASEVTVTLPEPAVGEDLFAALGRAYPKIKPLRQSLRLAVNREYVSWDHPVKADDEIALIPPVSGGSGEDEKKEPSLPFVEVVEHTLSADRYQEIVTSPDCGAVALFVGVVREFTGEKQTVFLRYEAYQEMAESEMRAVADTIVSKWPRARVALGHRTGELGIGEASVIVAVATPHRQAAFEAAKFGIDTIKERVPIWKKEVWADGEEWVGVHA